MKKLIAALAGFLMCSSAAIAQYTPPGGGLPETPLAATHGGTGLATSGTDNTKALMSDGAGGFVMGSAGGGSSVLTKLEGTITAAQIKALHTPLTLVSAPGADAVIELVDAVVVFLPGATAYVNPGSAGNFTFFVGSQHQLPFISAFGIIDQTSDKFINFTGGQVNGADSNLYVNAVNQPLTVQNTGSQDWTTGDGIIKYSLTYRVIQF